MKIKIITESKESFMSLLLLADEDEKHIAHYLGCGTMFALYDDELKGACVVTDKVNGVYEIENLAVMEEFQKQGYGKKLLDFIYSFYRNKAQRQKMIVGTDDISENVKFYERCGFEIYDKILNYFPKHYEHPIFENGEQLIDKIYLKKEYKNGD